MYALFPMAQQPLMGQDLIIEASFLHSNTPHSVALLWMSEQPYAELYLTTHDTHNRQTSIPPRGFEPTSPASELPQTYALDRVVTGNGLQPTNTFVFLIMLLCKKVMLSTP
jgi:hypothetical protein